MKIEEVVIPGAHPQLGDFIGQVTDLLNTGKYQLEITTSVPTFTTEEGSMILYASGTVRRLYTYINSQWNYFGFLNNDGKILVDGEIEIGTYLKADGTNGMWLGHADFASAPFRVSLAGALVATSATITGTITASAGAIAGWTIGASALTAGTGATAVGLAPGTYPFYAGNSTPASAPFYVSNAGAIKAISGVIGGWTLAANTLTATNIVLDNANDQIRVGSAPNVIIDGANKKITVGNTGSTHIIIDGANTKIETSDFASGSLGSGWRIESSVAEFQNVRIRGKITAATFEKDVVSAIGGTLVVLDGDILNADMSALDASTLTIVGDTTFAVGDILRINDGVNDEWLEVTNIASAPTYAVTRDKGSSFGADSNPAWKTGTAVVNYKQSGDGGITFTASEANAPHISIFTHAGSPWSTLTERLRIGNLNGFLSYSSDLYGIGIGEAGAYLTYDPTNGLIIRGTIYGEDLVLDDGDGNTIIGDDVLTSLTTGTYNVGIGIGVLADLTTGNYNIGIGYEALNANVSGIENIAIGYKALHSHTATTHNVAIGNYALEDFTSGTGNIALGEAAMGDTTTASYNTALGLGAGQVCAGNSNVFIGYWAGNLNTGAYNAYVGASSGYGNTGSNNVCLGYRAGYTGDGSSNVFLGYKAGYNETGSNMLYIANSDTSTPLLQGDFSTPALTINGSLTVTGGFFPRQVDDDGMDATDGTEGEIVYNLDDNTFYGCTVTGTPATWVALN